MEAFPAHFFISMHTILTASKMCSSQIEFQISLNSEVKDVTVHVHSLFFFGKHYFYRTNRSITHCTMIMKFKWKIAYLSYYILFL